MKSFAIIAASTLLSLAYSNPTTSKSTLHILDRRQCGETNTCTAADVKAVGVGGETYEWAIHRYWTEGVSTGPISTLSIDAILEPQDKVQCSFTSDTNDKFLTVRGDVASISLADAGFPSLKYIQCELLDDQDPLPCPEYPCCDGICLSDAAKN